MRRQQTGLMLVLESVALSADVENVAMVRQFVQCRSRYHPAAQRLSPVRKSPCSTSV